MLNMLNKGCEGGILILFLILEGTLSSFHQEHNVDCRSAICGLYYVEATRLLCSRCAPYMGFLGPSVVVELTTVETVSRAGSIQIGAQAESCVAAAALLANWARS